jgi:hypothetical protein
VTFAHVAGVPVEELMPLALAGGTGALVAARAWVRERLQSRRRSRVSRDG